MYKIEKKNYGYKITFEGLLQEEEVKEWVEKSKKVLDSAPPSFGVLVDMRLMDPLPPELQKYIEEGQRLYKEKGMSRSVVVLRSAVTKMQFQCIAKKTGIYDWERYIDASSIVNWEKIALNWIINSIDPDK